MSSIIIELGHIALITALGLSIFQVLFPIIGFRKNDEKVLLTTSSISIIGFFFTLFSFFTLVFGFINSDFSISLVSNFSHTTKPLIYKISGTWANHEGSLLLWIVILQLFSALIAISKIPLKFKVKVLSVQGIIIFAFLTLCLFSSNPFERNNNVLVEGSGLNPVLQDLALAAHPPILYIGYVGLSVSFAFAVGALIEGKINRFWASMVRPWILFSWVSLTIGIALGSYWAYYELGWGGWWFWDPVENAALMPWLLTTALVHSIIVCEQRNELKAWTILLSILAFAFSLLGTFLVRSGIITSVHSFASDPKRGLFILFILIIATLIPLTLFVLRSNLFKDEPKFNKISKESALIFNNFILVISAFIILLGTLYPLILEFITGTQITVGPPYFVTTLSPIMLIALLFMGIGPLLLWKKNKPIKLFYDILPCLIILLLFFIIQIIYKEIPLLALVSFSFVGWLVMNLILSLANQTGVTKIFKKNEPVKLKFLTISQTAVFFGHLGISVFALGVISDSYFNQEVTKKVKIGESILIGENIIYFNSISQKLGPNYISEIGELILYNKNRTIVSKLYPEKRLFLVEQQSTSEIAILRQIYGDLYVVLGEGSNEEGYTFRIYYKPLVWLIWLGAILMAFGGGISSISRFHKDTPKLLQKGLK